ncbi:TetR/AcrR family transcriptional regulator [Parvibaculum sedimenti]|uniref:TetR/AcrR family transcriptional regulator n=1 Tax=Parvibaculum sedimenti TaxID=2608632 RepID=UPI00163A1A98|nr:TetR/AcrR family transcriptional regulator [Parvibaculum sedimenti]
MRGTLENAQGRPRSGAGRPRTNATPPSDDARRDIIEAAARLFRAKGIAGASVREIAAEAGLQKASLYYYFGSKEEIVHAMIEGVLTPALAMQRRLGRAALSEAARLYAYLRFDVEQLCAAPYDCTWLINHGDLNDPQMTAFWADRNKLVAWIEARLKRGVDAGEFHACDRNMVAKAMIAATEYSVTWAERQDAARIVATAEEVASLLVRGVLAPGRNLNALRREAAAFNHPV